MPIRKDKKSSKKTKKKLNQSMIVHQIFFNIGKGELKEIPRFYKCYKNNKSKCKKRGIQYKLWTRNMVEKLLDKKDLISKLGKPSYIDSIHNKYFYFTEMKKSKNFYNQKKEYSYLFVFDLDKNDKILKSQSINLLELENNNFNKNETIIIGIGDNKNDIEMLDSGDFPCLVKNSKFNYKNLISQNYTLSSSEAPEGWKEVVKEVLIKLNFFGS